MSATSPTKPVSNAPRLSQLAQGPKKDPMGLLRRYLPSALVMTALIGFGILGHYSHWKLPKFSALTGSSSEERSDWCEEHSVPESICVECNPSLMPKVPDYGWCEEHGVHNCPLHHPDVAQLKTTPAVSQEDFERAARALATFERPANNSVCKVYQRRIQFASDQSVKQAGVDVELVDRQAMVDAIEGAGEITYDQTRIASLSPRASGALWHVAKNVGDRVQAGDILAIVDSLVVGQAKSELLDALVQENLQQRTLQRLQSIGQAVPGRQILEAETEFEKAHVAVLKAQQAFSNLGIPVDLEALRAIPNDEKVARLRYHGLENAFTPSQLTQITTANLLPIYAPMDGVVVARNVVAGEVVDTSTTLFQVADVSRMWLTLNIPLESINHVAVGQTVHFRPDGTGQVLSGILHWISTAADKQTRMVKVRAELDNASGQLRDETFGTGQIILREEPQAIVVPSSSVHWEGCCHIVFVRDKNYFASSDSLKVFHVRSVRLGAKQDGFTEIIAGLLPGEVVATIGSDVLSAQLLKNNLGEGCTCVE